MRAFFDAEADEASDVAGAMLVFGELVANVVRHAPGPIAIRIEWPKDGPPVLYVDDWGPGLDFEQPPDDLYRECGRGIEIVRAIARDVRVVTAPLAGTRIAVALPLSRRAA